MKNLRLINLLAFLFLLSSCTDDDGMTDIREIEPTLPPASALLNGVATTFETFATKDEVTNLIRLDLSASADSTNNYDRSINFSNIPATVGTLDSLFNFASPLLESRSYCYYVVANGDAVYAFYDLVENQEDSNFEISSINEETGLIKGVFTITLAIEEGHTPDAVLLLGDTIRLTEGYFETYFRN